MAGPYYWVGGTGNSSDATNHWSTSSGGAPNVGNVPASTDNVIFDNASSTADAAYTFTIDSTLTCADFTMGGPGSGNDVTWAGSAALDIYGSMNLSAGSADLTRTYTGPITFKSTATGKTIASNGVSFGGTVTLNGAGGGWTLSDAFSSTDGVKVSEGTFNTGSFNMTVTFFRDATAGTTSITLGTSTITCTLNGSTTVWQVTAAGTTFSGASSTIKFTGVGSSLVGFTGGGQTYGTVWFANGGSTGTCFLTQDNTISELKDTGTAAHNLYFQSSVTQTITTFTVSGSATKLVTINSCNASGTAQTTTHALAKAGGGTISSDYLNIQHSVATPSSTWYAGANSTDNQAVATAGSGWTFTVPPGGVTSVSPQFINVS